MLFENLAGRASPILVTALLLVSAPAPGPAATFHVTTVNDTGPGTLRQAILDANAAAGMDSIEFKIGSGGPRTIAPKSPLPPITEAVILDGTTQPGYASVPLIELNGSSAGENAGIRLLGGGSVVRGLAINRFAFDGIRIEGAGTNTIQGNFIGTDRLGTTARGNAQQGVFVYASWGNVIGGTNASDRNVISGNGDAGVYLLNGGGNIILGNLIGCSVDGESAVGNTNNGVAIYNSAANRIGTAEVQGRNIVSGNRASGLYLFGALSAANVVQGNHIGTDLSGTTALSNVADGITLTGAPRNVIGGNGPGEGNVISANGHAGIYVMAAGSISNSIAGNRIGCDTSGSKTLGNTLSGITLSGCSGTQVGPRNVVSGNKQEGLLLTTNSVRNTIIGNLIGVDATGLARLGNGFSGLSLVSGARSNRIGGASVAERNVISANTNFGLLMVSGADGNVVQGNFIGLATNGTAALGNSSGGLRIESAYNTVGGEHPGSGNIISGNGSDGILLIQSGAKENRLFGNFIGTDAQARAPLMNGRAGIAIFNAPQNQVGGPGTAGNVLSGNNDSGIFLIGAQAIANTIANNKIGTDASGTFALPNRYEGVFLWQARSNVVGGPSPELGNVISGNSGRGIHLTNSSWNVVQGNRIGLKADGASSLGNRFHGIDCEKDAHNNLIGGEVSAGNRIGFAQTVYTGVRVRNGSTGNGIFNNSIFSNGALGIDLGSAGILPSDVCDEDTGANQQQNAPVLHQAVNQPGTRVRGQLEASRTGVYRIQFFLNPACDAGGTGEGETYLGECVVSATDGCALSFEHDLNAPAPEGWAISATATDGGNNTSEFSNCVRVQELPILTVSALDQRMLTVSWAATTASYSLRFATSLLPPVQWELVRGEPVLQNGRFSLKIPMAQKTAYFILVRE